MKTSFADEWRIDVEGVRLSVGMAMTVRVALEMFAMQLLENGPPPAGTIEAGYLNRIQDIREIAQPARERQ